ncbi:putative cyclin 4 [Cardiosporidium cionae]|uniref:Cyclin 4 n=1 Tax=Cardiosporidium cionae TaxID=476202 RepID=A0ABQ7JG82_9APIC|nr:putative cyclin 4 [Cardiosporidium cionae]|eukprot:KAF8823027.1 putative cyclin 4 [Cardiosporidium cionae]
MANQLTLLPANILLCTPSRNDGISCDTEMKLRVFGCELIQKAGIMLRLQAVTIASGQTILHRFYFRRSLKNFEIRRLAAAALYLACKLEEDPRRVRDMINVFHYFEQQERASEEEPTEVLDVNSEAYERFRHDIVRSERYILRELGFMVSQTLVHPHRYILQYIHSLFKGMGAAEVRTLSQLAWGYLNDSMRTTLCCEVQPAVIAVGSIYLAACALDVALPKETGWYELFDVAWEDVVKVCTTIQTLYLISEFTYESLMQGVNKSSETEKDDAEEISLVLRSETLSPSTEISDNSTLPTTHCNGQNLPLLSLESTAAPLSSHLSQDIAMDATPPPSTVLPSTDPPSTVLPSTTLPSTVLPSTTPPSTDPPPTTLSSTSEMERPSRHFSLPLSRTAVSRDRKERSPVTKEMRSTSRRSEYPSASSSTTSMKSFSSTRMEGKATREYGSRNSSSSLKIKEGRNISGHIKDHKMHEKRMLQHSYRSRKYTENHHRRSRSREALPSKKDVSSYQSSSRKPPASDSRFFITKEASAYRSSSSANRSTEKGEMRRSSGEGERRENLPLSPSRSSCSSSTLMTAASSVPPSSTASSFAARSLPSKSS